MFGYVRPYKDELKVREYELFRSCYCSLCHTLRDEYGFNSSFILNYDFVYLAMLLWDGDKKPEFVNRRCTASPCRKKRCCCPDPALSRAAGFSIILAWYKLCDSVNDDSFGKAALSRLAKLFLRRSFKKASSRYPDFASSVERLLGELSALEKEKCRSLDEPADKFAQLLAGASEFAESEKKRRILRELLYHTGRWIYILDALDDLEDDSKSGSYNPLVECFEVKNGKLSENDLLLVEATLTHSRNICGASFELLDKSAWTDIIRNIIFLGMPGASGIILTGGTLSKGRFRPNRN